MRGTVGLLLVAALLAPGGLVAAQESEPPSAFTETVDVEVINVDVYVTDRAGNPVSDLTRDDFILLRDKKRIEFDYFYASGEAAGGRFVSDKGGSKRGKKAARRKGADWGRKEAVWREPPHIVPTIAKLTEPAGKIGLGHLLHHRCGISGHGRHKKLMGPFGAKGNLTFSL